ncbi:hypothetical protein ACFFX0_15720 [Citricoccus parietis]|uniref:Uncharacterized protein n=1 Tax=Citricoccus parietis TaxID=592307 RepID=A0ABV5G0V1_9MICC
MRPASTASAARGCQWCTSTRAPSIRGRCGSRASSGSRVSASPRISAMSGSPASPGRARPLSSRTAQSASWRPPTCSTAAVTIAVSSPSAGPGRFTSQ